MNYVIYDKYTGEIIKEVTCPQEQLADQLQEGEAVSVSNGLANSDIHYIDIENGTLLPKADYELSALPLPCIITIEGTTYEVTSQPTFEFDAPGVYTVQVDAGPHFLKKEFEIDYQP